MHVEMMWVMPTVTMHNERDDINEWMVTKHGKEKVMKHDFCNGVYCAQKNVQLRSLFHS